jgi:hypothetical protein
MLDAAFSFIVDAEPKFAYQGYHLARSILSHSVGLESRIYVQVTREVTEDARTTFRTLGCEVRQIERFGDGRYCNKLNQLETLREAEYRYAVLLDTDTIVLDHLGPLLTGESLKGRIVGGANPSLSALESLARLSGLASRPRVVQADCTGCDTFEGNLNGGLYVVPCALSKIMAEAWKRWTIWLLEHNEPLRGEGKLHHADQVGLWLAIHHANIPWEPLPANWNYNPASLHRSYDVDVPIALLHYHGALNAVGELNLPGAPEMNRESIARANVQFALGHRLIKGLN